MLSVFHHGESQCLITQQNVLTKEYVLILAKYFPGGSQEANETACLSCNNSWWLIEKQVLHQLTL